ncbi:MAG: PRC-barrel domain-containing protein [Bacillota bacterium]
MIRSLKELTGYDIISNEGEDIGKVKDFYFDSQELVVRYAVVDTGGWLTGRTVLISPESFEKPNWETKEFPVSLSKEEVENSPSVEEEKPVSRQMEIELASYYDWPTYWSEAGQYVGSYSTRPVPIIIDESIEDEGDDISCEEDDNCFLRSVKEVEGYNIQALDGEIGHLETLMVADNTWIVHYLVVDTRNWLPGKKVIVAPEWLERISYNDQEVYVALHKDKIENAPEYDPQNPITREYEEDLYIHYSKTRYW